MQVIIRHPRTGQEYEVAVSDYHHGKHYLNPKSGEHESYEDAGFRIVSQADGSPYKPPAPRPEAKAD